MTAVRPAPVSQVTAEAQVPRRVQAPRWLDLRLVLGLLLVLGSVLLGARVLAAADVTVPVWSAAGDLAAGSVLSSADLVAVDVRLDATADAYVARSVPVTGRVLGRSVHRGELLPRSALEQPRSLVQLALPVQAGYVPPSLARGQLVDVYAVSGPGGGAAAGSVSLVVAGVPVQDLSSRSAGVLSTPTTTVQVVVSVPAGRAAEVLGAIGGRPLAVVVHQSVEGGSGAGGGAAAPSATPSSGSPSSSALPSGFPSSASPPANQPAPAVPAAPVG